MLFILEKSRHHIFYEMLNVTNRVVLLTNSQTKSYICQDITKYMNVFGRYFFFNLFYIKEK